VSKSPESTHPGGHRKSAPGLPGSTQAPGSTFFPQNQAHGVQSVKRRPTQSRPRDLAVPDEVAANCWHPITALMLRRATQQHSRRLRTAVVLNNAAAYYGWSSSPPLPKTTPDCHVSIVRSEQRAEQLRGRSGRCR